MCSTLFLYIWVNIHASVPQNFCFIYVSMLYVQFSTIAPHCRACQLPSKAKVVKKPCFNHMKVPTQFPFHIMMHLVLSACAIINCLKCHQSCPMRVFAPRNTLHTHRCSTIRHLAQSSTQIVVGAGNPMRSMRWNNSMNNGSTCPPPSVATKL